MTIDGMHQIGEVAEAVGLRLHEQLASVEALARSLRAEATERSATR